MEIRTIPVMICRECGTMFLNDYYNCPSCEVDVGGNEIINLIVLDGEQNV